jgi:nucleoside-diphosphate-sugar epimerase
MGHSGAARSVKAPADDLKSNTLPHLVLLETLRLHSPLTRAVFPGSRLQYGKARTLPVPETHPQVPTSVYGQHKATAEGYYRLYHDIYGLPTTCLRISIPYGAGQARPDSAFGVVGTFLATARRGAPIRLYGGGQQRRDFLHIDDLNDLFIRCATHSKAVGRAYNASSEESLSLRGMADIVIETVGSGSAVAVDWPPLESRIETGDYFGDIRLAKEELGWEPQISLNDGIARVCAEESEGAWAALGVAQPARRP